MEKNLLAAIILSVALFFGVGFGWAQYDSLTQLQQAVEERERLLADRKMALESIRAFEQAHSAAAADIQRLSIFLLQKQKNDELVSSIYAAAIESGVQIRDISLGTSQPADKANLVRTPIAISITSSFQSVTRFLASLESSLRLYDVSDITMSNSGGGSGFSFDNNLDVALKLDAYHLP